LNRHAKDFQSKHFTIYCASDGVQLIFNNHKYRYYLIHTSQVNASDGLLCRDLRSDVASFNMCFNYFKALDSCIYA